MIHIDCDSSFKDCDSPSFSTNTAKRSSPLLLVLGTGLSVRESSCVSSSDPILVAVLVSVTSFITYRAKLLTADWLRQRAFFLNHDLVGTFGNQERA